MEGIITWNFYLPQPPDGKPFRYGINMKKNATVIAVDTISRVKRSENNEVLVFAQLICSVDAASEDIYREFLITTNSLEILPKEYQLLVSYSYQNNIFYLFSFQE
jgi:hypothetical protein